MSLTRKDLDELKPWVESTVEKVLGFSEPSIAHAALNCVEKGFDKRKTRVKLQDFLDEKSATKFCERFFLELDLQRAALSSRVKHPKRNRADEDEITDMIKKTRYEVASNGVGLPASNNNPAKPLPAATLAALNAAAAKVDQIPDINQLMPGEDESATPLSTDQIKAMMENAKRMIAQKKAELGPPPPPQALMTRMLPPPAVIASVRPEPEDPDLPIPGPRSRVLNSEEQDKLKRAAELQAQIKSKLLGMTMVPDLMSVEVRARAAAAAKAAEAPKPKTQAPKLIVDSEGRTIDAQGNEVTLAPRAPELKANLRAVKREEFKKGTQSVMPKEVEVNKYLDYRIEAKAADRTKRSFKFHDAGKFQQMASRLRTKAQLEKLQNQISLAAKKTGISSAARLAGLVPKKDASEGAEIPQVEWWDYYILEDACYDYLEEKGADAINDQVLTNLIEHPLQMDPPANANKPIHLPIMLTKRERKKLRRQTRNEALKEKTEKVRLGLEAPPEPKMRISNLMRVLGTEAVADPTKMEAHVRAQMAKRQRVHEEANAARKLTKEQRTEKKKKKIGEDMTGGVHVAVFRVKNLSDPAKKFKVEANANQLQMTGAVVMCKDINIIIVEGGPKQQKKFKRLLLHRIKWEEAGRKEKKDQEGDEESAVKNKCSLVWEGTVLRRNFGEMKFKICPTESFGREHLRQRNVEHYWDIAHADSVIESSAE